MRSMTGRQFTDWKRFYEVEPFGFRARWVPFALLCSVVANVMGGRSARSLTVDDFMPVDTETVPRQQTGQEILEAFKAFAAAQKSRMKRNARTKRE